MNISEIEGVGESFATKLEGAGAGTVEALLSNGGTAAGRESLAEATQISDAALAYRLRTGTPAVMGRLRDGKLLLDVRTVFAQQEEALIAAILAAVIGSETTEETADAMNGEVDE